MNDLRERFRSLDALPVPQQWDEITRRATASAEVETVQRDLRPALVGGSLRLVAIVALLALAAGLAAVGVWRFLNRPTLTDLTGTWIGIVEPADRPPPFLGFRESDGFVVSGPVDAEAFTWTSTGQRLTVTGKRPTGECEGVTGTYRWSGEIDRLELVVEHDPCQARRALLTGTAWERSFPFEGPAHLTAGSWRTVRYDERGRVNVPDGGELRFVSDSSWHMAFDRPVAGAVARVHVHQPESFAGDPCEFFREGQGPAGQSAAASVDTVLAFLRTRRGLVVEGERPRTFAGYDAVEVTIRTLPECTAGARIWYGPDFGDDPFTGEHRLVLFAIEGELHAAEALDTGPSLELLEDLAEWLELGF